VVVAEGVNSVLHGTPEKIVSTKPVTTSVNVAPKTVEEEIEQIASQQQEMIDSLIHITTQFRDINEHHTRKVEKVQGLNTEANNLLKAIAVNTLTANDLKKRPETDYDAIKMQYIFSFSRF
jgi:hypothetical protein